ncbi:hypothetical protein O181_132755 [Austropuccinia psidii MF-1]|uniref:Uncharacterized protein n=1 Tax=Austropuccinia psidii MF-1 TaxID=1389203 RepID=A0A9Q3L3E4_9BASI|nr:hypothetical protein [Austropuccinia psidii MF-1]
MQHIVGHLDDQNYDRFLSEDENDPLVLWKKIKDYYGSSSAENITSNFGKLFSIKFPSSSSSLSASISLFCSTLEILFTLSPPYLPGILFLISEEDDNVALKVGNKPKKELYHKGKHNPLSNHSESECFQLYPEERKAHHKHRNNHHTPGTGISLEACNSSGYLSNQPILDSGCSNTVALTTRYLIKIIPSKETLLSANGTAWK